MRLRPPPHEGLDASQEDVLANPRVVLLRALQYAVALAIASIALRPTFSAEKATQTTTASATDDPAEPSEEENTEGPCHNPVAKDAGGPRIERDELRDLLIKNQEVHNRAIDGQMLSALLADPGLKIDSEDISFSDVVIEGKLSIGPNRTFAKPASWGGLHFVKCRFTDSLSFRNLNVARRIEFDRCDATLISLESVSCGSFLSLLNVHAQSLRLRRCTIYRIDSPLSCFGACNFRTVDVEGNATFIGTSIERTLSLSFVNFAKGANFSRAAVGKATLLGTTFGGQANFSAIRIFEGFTALQCVVNGNLGFESVRAASADVVFRGTVFKQTSSFQRSKMRSLRIVPSALAVAVVGFGERAYFNNLHCDEFSITGAIFYKGASFNGFSGRHIDINSSTFLDDMDLRRVDLQAPKCPEIDPDASEEIADDDRDTSDKAAPKPVGISMTDVELEKGILTRWPQAEWGIDQPTNLLVGDSEMWKSLEGGFEASHNLAAKNEAMYRRLIAERGQLTTFEKLANLASWAFWGYGVRPLRLTAWIVFSVVAFALLYMTQFRVSTRENGSDLSRRAAHFLSALQFSRRTAWGWNFGYIHSRNTTFRIITTMQSLATKVMLILLLQSLANVSPLLNSIAGKFIPL